MGVTPNVASAEALIQSCQDCPHLSIKVNSLTGAFQPALAALHKLPAANLPQGMTAQNMALLSPDGMSMPSGLAYDSLMRFETARSGALSSSPSQGVQSASSGALQRVHSGNTDVLRSAFGGQGAGQSAATPRPGLLPADALSGPHATVPSAGSRSSAPGSDTKAGHVGKRPGSGLSAGAPTTPDLQSEGEEDVSPQDAGKAS